MPKQRVLMCNMGDPPLRGQELVLLDLLDHLDRERFDAFVWSNNPALSEAARQRGFEAVDEPFENFFQWGSRRFDPVRYARLVRRASHLIRETRASLVHANGAGPCQWLVPACRIRGKPLLAHLHIGYLKRNRLVLAPIFANRLVGVSRATVAPLVADGVAPERIAVVRNGIDASGLAAAARRPAALAEDETGHGTVIAAGSLVERKGYDTAIRAVRLLVERGVPVRLLVAGTGPERPRLEESARGLPVRFLGELDRTEILGLFQAVEGVMVLPSHAEGFPLSILEAAAFGVPTVASRVDGIPEFIEDGRNGLLIDPGDAPALAERLESLLASEARRQAMGDAARRDVHEGFSATTMARAFEALYMEMLARPDWLSAAAFARQLASWRASAHR